MHTDYEMPGSGAGTRVRVYMEASGGIPFTKWLAKITDPSAKDRIFARLLRSRTGNFGDWKAVGSGVNELRINYGPGYRIYFGREGDRIIILLAGGTKRKQNDDIEKAKRHWRDYQATKRAVDY